MIDSHCHLGIGIEWQESGREPELLLKNAHTVGVTDILTVACHYNDKRDLQQMMSLPNVWGAFGIHPENASIFDLSHVSDTIMELQHIVALGEIGLDYFYGPETRINQIKAFEKQIELAAKQQLPIIIHTRDADNDTIQILNSAKKGGLLENGGVLHCFTGSRSLAEAALDIGLYISASGIITFKKAEKLRQIFKDVPINKLLVETDAPYLAPVPYRGKANEPAYVIETARVLAHIKDTDFENINSMTTQNFKQLFKVKGE